MIHHPITERELSLNRTHILYTSYSKDKMCKRLITNVQPQRRHIVPLLVLLVYCGCVELYIYKVRCVIHTKYNYILKNRYLMMVRFCYVLGAAVPSIQRTMQHNTAHDTH